MGERLFAALWPPADLVEELDFFLAPRREAEARLRWTRPETWHVTLVFMGDVDDWHADRLVEGLAAVAARTPPFGLGLTGGGAFPWPLQTKNLWLGADAGVQPLTQLAERSRNAAVKAGVRIDGARFTPHLTLARANRPLDSTRLIRVLDTFVAPPWEVRETVLVASHLHDRANRFEVVERFALTGGPARETDEA
ncbi:MAG: RNA 2',3'-cyclic phosphodiesterase [Actinomycetes bacterium]